MDGTRVFGDKEPLMRTLTEVLAGIASADHDAGSSIADRKEHHEQPGSSSHVAPGGR
jgi:hypothetical protein